MKTLYNEDLNGLEVYFDTKPAAAIITGLKSHFFRWHNVKKCWYAKKTQERENFLKEISEGKTPAATAEKSTASANVIYYKYIYDYIDKKTYEENLKKYYDDKNYYYYETPEQKEKRINDSIAYKLKEFDNKKSYCNELHYIREAIIWKSLGNDKQKFYCNGDNAQYEAIWDRLPTIKGLKENKNKTYAAMWGYDQTQITTATHYGKAWGLDVLITGGFGHGEVLLKRISKDGEFKEGCMYFSPNRYTSKEIQETNSYALMFGR